MNGSILTNQGAMVALQTIKSINKNLSGVQDMISTGKRVATSKDNAAIWAISSVMESDVSSFKAVTDSLALGQSTVAVARNAAEQVKDSLIEIKSKIIAAQEENVDRDKIQADVDAIRSQIKSIVGASQFNGLNLLKSGENLEVLSSVDRSSNGSTTTSTINIEAKSLDSGSNADSVAGTAITAAVNEDGATITAAFVTNANPATVTPEGKATLGTFTNSSQEFDFSTTVALDEGDSVAFSFTDGNNTATFTYTQTATGTARTSGEELAKQLKNAYTAFAARDAKGAGVTTSTYNATTKTFTATEGTFVVTGTGADTLNTLELTENAGTLTVVNKRDTGVIFTVGNEVDRVATNIPAVATSGSPTAVAASANANFDISAGTVGLQQDDSYAFTLRNTAQSDSQITFTVTGAALSSTELATTIHDALNAFKAGGISSTGTTSYNSGDAATSFTATSTAGRFTAANGASISLAYDVSGGITETAFVDEIDGTTGTATFTNPSSGVVNIANAGTGDALAFFGAITEGSAATSANIAVSNTNNVANLTPSTQNFAFTTTASLDEGDTVQFSFSNGIDSFNVNYTQTAQGNAQTTGEELSSQLAAAYTAFKAGTNTSSFVSSTNTYTGTEGTFVFSNGATGNATNLKNLTFTDNAGTLTIANSGTAALTLTVGAESDYTPTNLSTTANVLALGTTANVNLNTANIDGTGAAANSAALQSDDSYNFIIGQDADDDGAIAANDAFATFNIAAGTSGLTRAQLADTIQRVSAAYTSNALDSASTSYSGGDAEIAYGGAPGTFTVNGATVTVSYSANGGGLSETNFQTATSADLTVTNGASGVVSFVNSSTSAGTADYALSGQLVVGTAPATPADVRVNGNGLVNNVGTGAIAAAVGSGVNNITAGTLGDFLTVDVNNTANQVGDTLSITLAGVNEEDGVAQPITYTAANGATEADIATGFATAINTALSDAGIKDVVASTRAGGLIDIKNFNITTTKEVKNLSVVNELTTAAVATDANGVVATSIAAGATNKVTFGATKPTKGDTYSVTVGSTTAKYVARQDDDLNTIGRNIEGLLKLKSNANITVDFTSVDDPAGTNTVLTVKNNGTSAITSFSATVKSGGTAGGGLELLDDIDVTNGAKAEGSLDLIESLIEVAIDAASSYGSSEKRLEGQQEFISKLTDSLKSGIGSLVDANLEETSARLQALQVQQQLGTQALSIANQSPQSILSLFR